MSSLGFFSFFFFSFINSFLSFRRGDLPFTTRRTIPRSSGGGGDSEEESEVKSETPEPKPEWTAPLDSFKNDTINRPKNTHEHTLL